MPEEYYLNDKALYRKRRRTRSPTYSRTGMITEEGMKAAMELLSFDPEIASAKVDSGATFDPSFVEAAAKE